MAKISSKEKLIRKLLKTFPHVKNITCASKKNNDKGTIILFNELSNRKYYIYKSGYAKAVSQYNDKTDFINAWVTDWQNCRSMDDKALINALSNYIEYFDKYERNYSLMYGRKREPSYVYNIVEDKYYFGRDSLD